MRVNAPKGRLTPELEAALVAQKSALVEVLSDPSLTVRGRRPISAVPRTGSLPVSFLQERLWVLDQIQPGHTAYNLATASDDTSGIDIGRLCAAVQGVVARHEILRAKFVLVDGAPRMLVGPPSDTPIAVRDLRALPPEERIAILDGAASVAAHEPFDLATDTPIRFTVLQTGDDSGALLIAAHHIAMDSWSLGILRQEIITQYLALTDGAEPLREPSMLQYADFAGWQRGAVDDAAAQARLRFWLGSLAGLPQLSTFATDRPRSADVAGVGATHDFRWPRSLYDDVRALARELDATVYMVLLAAMTVVLSRNTGQSDVAIGSPIGTRELAELESMLGPILNPLVLRFDVSDDPTFATLVHRARSAVLDGHANQDVPFEMLVQSLNPERSLGHSPLFQVAVVLHNAPDAGAIQIHGGGAIYDVTLFAVERGGDMVGAIEYRADLYDAASMARIDAEMQALLTAATRNAQLSVSRIPLLSEAETALLVETLMPAPVEVDRTTVVAQFERTAAAFAGDTAVVAADETLTYAELDRRSSLVAEALRVAGCGRGSFVALATDRSSAMVVGALGILKAGAAYVPTDLTYPADRVTLMLQDSGAQHVVTTAAAARGMRDIELPPSVLVIDELIAQSREVHPAAASHNPAPDDIAYLMYTSGSTGTPKGVLVPHSALSNFLGAMRERHGLAPHDGVLCVTSMSFDISVLEVFLPLVTGARTIIATREDASDGARLAALIKSTGATVVQSTPSGWRLLMQANWRGDQSIVGIAGGESMPHDLARWMGERVRQVWNGYGPTETTVYSSMALLKDGDAITIGTPVANTRIYVMDAGGNIAPIGAIGEICIGGDSVTRGYHKRPELTAEKFVPDPFVNGRLMYRTGDYGRWRADGRLDHLGRIDGQVKLRGYRIETGEIEAALVTHEMVRGAVVGVRTASADDPRLVAWVQLHDDAECTASELRRHLRHTLPEYMIPSMLVMVEAFPLTPNAKIDRRALPDPFAHAPLAPREYVAPTTPTQQQIAEIWMRLLGVPQAGVTDGFFELGGHSLLAMRAAGEISARTGRTIEPRLLFFRTLGQLAEACDAPADVTSRSRS